MCVDKNCCLLRVENHCIYSIAHYTQQTFFIFYLKYTITQPTKEDVALNKQDVCIKVGVIPFSGFRLAFVKLYK